MNRSDKYSSWKSVANRCRKKNPCETWLAHKNLLDDKYWCGITLSGFRLRKNDPEYWDSESKRRKECREGYFSSVGESFGRREFIKVWIMRLRCQGRLQARRGRDRDRDRNRTGAGAGTKTCMPRYYVDSSCPGVSRLKLKRIRPLEREHERRKRNAPYGVLTVVWEKPSQAAGDEKRESSFISSQPKSWLFI